MTTCTVKQCFEEKERYDTLFCQNDRIEWRRVCTKNFGFDEQADEQDINKLLGKFQRRFE